MTRLAATLLVVAVCSAAVHADVTIVQKTTAEGGPAAMAGAAMPSPTVTNRIKGLKGRMDLDSGNPNMPVNVSSVTDAAAKQVTVLNHGQKTARIATAAAPPPAAAAAAAKMSMNVDGAVAPTGKSQTIEGLKCDEYSFTTSMSMADASGGQIPPEMADALKDVRMVMKGSMWIAREAPGAAEYRAYQKAVASGDLMSAILGATGVSMPGMDKMAKAMLNADGVPMLTEMEMTAEGTGPIADTMRQLGGMRIITKVLSIKTDAISDDVFKVPEGYQIVK